MQDNYEIGGQYASRMDPSVGKPGATLIGLSLVIITTMGLKQIRDASKQRNDQVDQMEAQSNALVTGLTAQTAALEKLLERK